MSSLIDIVGMIKILNFEKLFLVDTAKVMYSKGLDRFKLSLLDKKSKIIL